MFYNMWLLPHEKNVLQRVPVCPSLRPIFPHAGISHYRAHPSKLKCQPRDIPVAWTPHSAQTSSLSSLMSLFCPSIPSGSHCWCNPWIPSLSSHICGHLTLSSVSRNCWWYRGALIRNIIRNPSIWVWEMAFSWWDWMWGECCRDVGSSSLHHIRDTGHPPATLKMSPLTPAVPPQGTRLVPSASSP